MDSHDPSREAARSWHLTPSSVAHDLVGAEFGIMRLSEAFQRLAVNVFRLASDYDASFSEIQLLHVVRMHDRPKDAATIGHLLNRDDLPNILYGLRKLVSAKLVRKFRAGSTTTFGATPDGVAVTDRYAAVRHHFISPVVSFYQEDFDELAEVTHTLRLMAGIFDSQTRHLATLDPSALLGDET